MDPKNVGRFKFGGSVWDTLVRCNSRRSVKLDVQAPKMGDCRYCSDRGVSL